MINEVFQQVPANLISCSNITWKDAIEGYMIRLSVQDYDCSESESIENQHHVARYVMEGDGKVTHPAETSFL